MVATNVVMSVCNPKVCAQVFIHKGLGGWDES